MSENGITPHLQSSLLLAKDLSEQPESPYILIVSGGAERKPNYYAIESWYEVGHRIDFQHAGATVYSCRVQEGSWAVVSRSASRVVTEQSMLEFAKEDAEIRKKFYQDLDPEAYAAAEEEAKRPQNPFAFVMPTPGHGHAPPPVDESKPTPGQYL